MLACKIGFWFSKNEDGGNKELLLEALLYFEKSLEVAKVNGLPDGIMRAKAMITAVRSNMGEAEHNAANLRHTKQMYEKEAKKSESSVGAIQLGVGFAETLKKIHHRGVECMRLLIKLREICHRVHGSDHKLTQLVCSKKDDCSTIFMKYEGNDNRLTFMDYDGCFEKCVAYNKQRESSKRGLSKREELSLLPLERMLVLQSLSIHDVVFENGTIVFSSPDPIVSNDSTNKFLLGDLRIWQVEENFSIEPAELNAEHLVLGDIRAWNKDTESYTIHWEDENISPCSVPRGRVYVPCCICDECIKSNKQFTSKVIHHGHDGKYRECDK